MNDEIFLKNDRHRHFVKVAGNLVNQFAERADLVDQNGSFPFENFEALKQAGFLSLTIPKENGGEEISLYEFVMIQEQLAQGDASTALSLGWHLGVLLDLSVRRDWPEPIFKELCVKVVKEQRLINRVHAELATGNPSRGAKPETMAFKQNDKWLLNGRKSYASMAPALDYLIVSATIADTGEVGGFLIPATSKGVRVESNWDTLGMRGTRSDDIVLDNVVVGDEAFVEFIPPRKPSPLAWLLHIPACYLGIAIAARNEAVRFANEYKPNSLQGPIKDEPEVRRKVGTIELKLLSARHFLYSVAERWDQEPEKRDMMEPELAAVKTVATNTAIEVVREAMRIVGGQSFFSSNPLQRYFRDVQAGIHNPPSDDSTLSLLANRAFENI
ncbi:acyl-CoA/acyl-ACP dehydrogenase [Paenibacillus filicis]|uniref:Acyl-CoA/acyl-ACP dehydrogenase n=1 Tax=Paenibacillus gyeongsangnamensis TaxID=3388067 RepID=A0ABT4QJT8_9BACL|nr:acyl-CoA dehydrogenase family protein [Paenibacillus filicis]MCZ8516966.1 acyl-CoA/acyl-ACP dehydrogenase [Paenibacillus filicis]